MKLKTLLLISSLLLFAKFTFSQVSVNYNSSSNAITVNIATSQYQNCVNRCNTNPSYWARRRCISNCRIAANDIDSYTAIVVAAFDRIPRDPRANTRNWSTFTRTGSRNGSFRISLPSIWRDRARTNNTCFGVRIIMRLKNGRVIDRTVWDCRIIG